MIAPIRFIVIDDDFINNLICSILLEPFAGESAIKTFEIAEEGLHYIISEYSTGKKLTILFLDINMPTWSGWEFLENFELLDEKIKDQIKIYMLSSSVDPTDKERALENRNVVDYIEKPINEKCILSILATLEITAQTPFSDK